MYKRHDTRLRIAILASGSGSNLEAILKAWQDGKLKAKPVAIVSNNPNAYALQRAEKYNIPAFVVDHRPYGKNRKAHEQEIINVLKPYNPQLLVLAGYMRVITPHLINYYRDIMNIHPADTRQYQGAHGYEFALGLLKNFPWRLQETKITVHFVDSGIDTGPIIAQKVVPIFLEDSIQDLKERGLAVEHQLYPACINLYATNQLERP